MDILRRELNEVYAHQRLEEEALDQNVVADVVKKVKHLASCTGLCWVVTDISADCCYFLPGKACGMLGLDKKELETEKIDSSDEDFLYQRILPMDLAELRMLEYEFFKVVDAVEPSLKLGYKAFGQIAMQGDNRIVFVNKTTQVLALSPRGKIWLVLCGYDFTLAKEENSGINPVIADLSTGDYTVFHDFGRRREDVLTMREKQVLHLIAEGKLSKEIASKLNISVNTVNRHRQNILEKLSVCNSMEAVAAARAMGILL